MGQRTAPPLWQGDRGLGVPGWLVKLWLSEDFVAPPCVERLHGPVGRFSPGAGMARVRWRGTVDD